jgi:predicted phosphodiesterase
MEAVGKHTIPVKSLEDTWELYVLSDVHLGNRGCSLSRFRSVVDHIANTKRCGVILLGDQIDAIPPGDKRFDATVLDPRSLKLEDLADIGEAMYNAFMVEVEPIRSKIIAALMGNHELSLMRRHGQARLHEHFCNKIDALNMGVSGFIDLVFEDTEGYRQTFRARCHHGAGAAITPGGKINRLIRFMHQTEADIVITGHTHESLEYTRSIIAANRACTKLTHLDQLGVVAGTYLRTYAAGITGYGELRGYSPTAIGSPAIEITPASRTLGVRWLRG